MKYLFFDTETNGLPRDYKAHYSDTKNWPRIVQLAWILTDYEGQALQKSCDIIKPEGFVIPDDMIHGISHQRAIDEGIKLRAALMNFSLAMRQADVLVCHNSAFDSPIVACEMIRVNGIYSADMLYKKPAICTMESSTNFCSIPSPYKAGAYKWPRLTELHEKLFNEGFDGAHDALADVKATVRCFFELRRLEIILPNVF